MLEKGMKGRKPKPYEQKLREGNPGKRKLIPAATIARQPAAMPALPAA